VIIVRYQSEKKRGYGSHKKGEGAEKGEREREMPLMLAKESKGGKT